jgi:hypothetical protein
VFRLAVAKPVTLTNWPATKSPNPLPESVIWVEVAAMVAAVTVVAAPKSSARIPAVRNSSYVVNDSSPLRLPTPL